MPLVPTKHFLNGLVAEAISSSTTTFNGVLKGAQMGLFTNTPLLSHDTVAGDLTPPSNTSYVKKNITWAGPYLDEGDRSSWVLSQAVNWGIGSDTAPQTITGFAVFDGADSVTVNYAELLPEPVNLTNPSDVLVIMTRVQPRDSPDWGSATVEHS